MKCTNQNIARADQCGPARYVVCYPNGTVLDALGDHRYNVADSRELACDECAAKWVDTMRTQPMRVEPLYEPPTIQTPTRIERVRHDNQPMPWS